MMQSILDPVAHARLIRELLEVLRVANVPPQFVHSSAKSYCSETELDWLTNFHEQREAGVAGLAMIGVEAPENRCMAICGALLRNFVDARLVPLNVLIDDPQAGMSASVLVIPNFYMRTYGKAIPAWKVQPIYDVLLARMTAVKPSVLFIESLKDMEAQWGPGMASLIKNHYRVS